MMDMWRGLGEPQRVLITDKICREQHPFREQVQPSPRLVADAQSYKDKFLGPDDYIAVITRFEMTGLSRQYEIRNDTHAEIPRCIRKTLFQLEQLRKDTDIQNTFVSIDIGKYGSISFAKKKYYHHLPEMMEFVRVANRGKMAMADIERTLESVSGTTDSGYIASLQQLIVTRAKCILFMGGGSFQRHALTHVPGAAPSQTGPVHTRSGVMHQPQQTNQIAPYIMTYHTLFSGNHQPQQNCFH